MDKHKMDKQTYRQTEGGTYRETGELADRWSYSRRDGETG